MFAARTIVLVALPALCAGPALSASSEWHHVQGGSVRIVTSGAPDADGLVRGALQIDLKPGWKTYWLDPGSSGVPPQLSVTVGDENADVQIDFPAPQRFDDGYSLWAGYNKPVTLALTMRLPDKSGEPAQVDASTFLGVCETICIPVQANLTFDPYADVEDPADALLVQTAFAALPLPAEEDLSAVIVDVGAEAITVEAKIPHGAEASDLFVASHDSLTLGVPERSVREDNMTVFTLPILRRGKSVPAILELPYTLVTSAGAVSGKLTVR